MKKAQMQILMTIAILLIFFALVGIGLIIYVNIKTGQTIDNNEEANNIRATQMAQTVFSLPSLKCPEQVTGLMGCIDYDSIQTPVTEYLGYGKATIKYLTLRGEQKTAVIYDKQLPSLKKTNSLFRPMNLYSQTSKNYLYGIMEIEVYS